MYVFTHDLARIDLILRRNEEASAILKFVKRISEDRTRFHRDHRAVCAALKFAFERLIGFKAVRHNGFALTGS